MTNNNWKQEIYTLTFIGHQPTIYLNQPLKTILGDFGEDIDDYADADEVMEYIDAKGITLWDEPRIIGGEIKETK